MGRTLAMLMSGEPVESISWGRAVGTEQWQEGDVPAPPLPGYTAPCQRRKQLSKHPPSQFRSGSASAPCGKWQHEPLSLEMVNSSPWGGFAAA